MIMIMLAPYTMSCCSDVGVGDKRANPARTLTSNFDVLHIRVLGRFAPIHVPGTRNEDLGPDLALSYHELSFL